LVIRQLRKSNSSTLIIIIIIIIIIINKYQELANEIRAIWKQNTAQVIPILISTGVIPKSLPQNLMRLNLHPITYVKMKKTCNSRHMFNCMSHFKL